MSFLSLMVGQGSRTLVAYAGATGSQSSLRSGSIALPAGALYRPLCFLETKHRPVRLQS